MDTGSSGRGEIADDDALAVEAAGIARRRECSQCARALIATATGQAGRDTSVAPASWLAQRDVDRGRRELNFSEWDRRPQGAHRRLKESYDRSRKARTPPP